MLLRKLVVACVVRGYTHYRTRTVTCQYVVAYPHLHLVAVDGVDGICARKHAGLFLGGGQTLDFVGFGNLVAVGFHLGALRLGGDLLNKGVFRRKHDVGTAEQRVGARGKHLETAATVGKVEYYFAAYRFTDPVSLHRFGFFRPI